MTLHPTLTSRVATTLTRPKIVIYWVRGRGRLVFGQPRTFLNSGLKGSGKSSLLECVATRFLKHGKLIDLFGSRDNEALAWCRVVPRKEVLFVTGDSVTIKGGKWKSVSISDLNMRMISRHRVILSVSAFYGDLDEEFHGLSEIVFKHLYKRTFWDHPWMLLVREASNFIYARIKVGKNQDQAKADFIYLLRESRHMGYSVGVDTIRWTSIDKEIRDVSDYNFLKRAGTIGLPRDLRFVYSYIKPPAFMNPKPSHFAVVDNRGPIGMGWFEEVPWHKKEREDILGELGLTKRIKRGEVPKYGERYDNIVGDDEHSNIIMKRFEGLSMHKIASIVDRSSNTVMNHIHNHDEEVDLRGYCLPCRRVKSPLSTHKVGRV